MEANKQKEFRIGNFVEYHDDGLVFEILEVDQLGLRVKNEEPETAQETWIEYDCFSPIKLTEEWLIKFGFRIGRKNYSLNSGRELHEYARTDYFIIWHNIQKGWCINELPDSKQYYFQYVHQLQNLYHALTGTELN